MKTAINIRDKAVKTVTLQELIETFARTTHALKAVGMTEEAAKAKAKELMNAAVDELTKN